MQAQIFISPKTATESILEHMKHSMQIKRGQSIQSHITRLKAHSEFFQKTTTSDQICFGCLLRMSEIYLPCGCVLCEICCRCYSNSKNNLLELLECPLCSQYWEESFLIRLAPPTAGYRLLELERWRSSWHSPT